MSDNVKKINIEDYNYSLSEDRIAKYPLQPRDSSKLLVYKNESISETVYSNLGSELPRDTILIFNQTKVVQARLLFEKNEGTLIEIFCLEPLDGTDIQEAMATAQSISYKCLVGGARKWKSGVLKMTTRSGTQLTVEKGENLNGSFAIHFNWNSSQCFAEILNEAGQTPLPPYLNRQAEPIDKTTYQTIFAQQDGSVAAPTAGLHFTKSLLDSLESKGIERNFLTLHVGAGTFKPVSSKEMADHDMHAEEFFVEQKFLEFLINNLDKNIIPVGTTSMRALESMYWLGCLLQKNSKISPLAISQWVAYEWEGNLPTPKKALEALHKYLIDNSLEFLMAKTSIIIAPTYKHKLCTGLLTNFHQPKSTLLLLVASMVGEKWKDIYGYALANDFRFLSYGDGCLILNQQ